MSSILESSLAEAIASALSDLSDYIGEIIDRFSNEIVQSLILLIIVSFLNSIFMTLFGLLFGMMGIKIAVCTICPIVEEIGKLTAQKYIGDGNSKVSTYNIIFNICEYGNYIVAMLTKGANLPLAIGFKVLPVIMHTVNTLLIKNGAKEGLEAKTTMITIFIHIVYSSLAIALDPKLTKVLFNK